MPKNESTYSTQIAEIVKFWLSNPLLMKSDVVSHYVAKCRKSRRQVQRDVAKAEEEVSRQVSKQNKAIGEALTEETREAVKKGARTKGELLEKYWKVIDDYFETVAGVKKAKKIGNIIVMPTAQDFMRAGAEVAKLQGYYAPEKSEVEVTDKQPKEVIVKFGAL